MTKLKNLIKIDLPREKILKYGVKKLQDYELLAVLLGSGIKGKNVLSLSKTILQKLNTIGIKNITIDDIKGISGVGSVKAIQILAIIELGNRLSSEKNEIFSLKDIWNLCQDFRNSKKEHLVAFFLDTQSRLIERRIISIGTLSSSLIHPRELFEPAIALNSASIIIAHNHPSGCLEASESDLKITKILTDAGKLLGIPIEKHIIISSKGYQKV